MSSKPVTWVLAPSLTAKTTAPRFAACANAPCGRAVRAQRRGTASRRSEARSRCGRGGIATTPRPQRERASLRLLAVRSEEYTSELQSLRHDVCRLLPD